jgi:hypothetical protein
MIKRLIKQLKMHYLENAGLMGKVPKSLIYQTAKTPRTPRMHRECISPKIMNWSAL